MKHMKTKIEIKNIFGKLLFEFECENNTIKKTVEKAIESSANLSYANLSYAKQNELTSFLNIACPEEGSFIAYKKANGKIIKLMITEDAKRSSATTLKCRASKAQTISIENIDGTPYDQNFVSSDYDSSFIYRIGEVVEVTTFDEDRWNECAPGIHFFLSKELAKQYN